jgi:hypothetical protein
MTSFDRRLLSAAAVIFVAFLGTAVFVTVATGSMLDIASGVWLSLAVDFGKGVLYRPLLSDAGVGGTRYFPLTFVVHGWLIRFGLPPTATGHAIELLSAAALAWAAWRVLHESSAPPPLARALAVLTLCSTPAMLAITTIRGDLPPAALNLWGVLFALRAMKQNRGWDLSRAVVFFSLAGLAKPTALYAVPAMATAFVLGGQRRRAALLVGGTSLTVVMLLFMTDIASDGRMARSFRVCATLGTDWSSIRRAPLTAASALIRQDPVSTVLLILVGVSLVDLRRDQWKEPLTVLMIGCLAMVGGLFASPGVDFNHLIDVFVVATVFVGVQIARRPHFGATAAKAISVGVLLSLVAFYLDIRHAMLSAEVVGRTSVSRFVRDMPREGTIFSDNGIVPSSIGERNFVLDGYMLPALEAHDIDVEPAIARALGARQFGAVILMTADPRRLAMLYGASFPALLDANYDLVREFSSFLVYRPKASR